MGTTKSQLPVSRLTGKVRLDRFSFSGFRVRSGKYRRHLKPRLRLSVSVLLPRKLGMVGPRLGLVRWLLFSLDLLSLLFVALLEVLRLLLVALLCLLSPGVICILLSQTLMFLFLLLLEFLMLLFLFGVELLLLLLVLLIALGVARVRRAIDIRFAIGGRLVAPSRFSGRHGVAVVECSGPRSRRYGRFAMVYGGAQLPVGAGFVKMLILRPNGPDMAPAARDFFFGGGPLVNATVAAVIADAVYRRIVVYDRGVVGVMDFRDIDVVH